jgi:hypothetical protein
MDVFELADQARIPMPTFEQIQSHLTPEVLERVKLLPQPKLICVPTRNKQGKPIRYQELAQSLNAAKAAKKTNQVHTGNYTFVLDDIKDGSKVKYRNGSQLLSQAEYYAQSSDWEVWVVEGAEEMPTPDQLPNQKFTDFPKGPLDINGNPTEATNQQKFDYMLSKYNELNLQGITYEMWAILLMDYLRQGKVIDNDTLTCLLGNTLDTENTLAAAEWSGAQPLLYDYSASHRYLYWRSRGAVRVM